MNELKVNTKTSRLYLNIWDDGGFIHTVWQLCPLHGMESSLTSGRFRKHRPAYITTNRIEITPLPSMDAILTWIGGNVESAWSMDFTDDPPISLGGPFGMSCINIVLNLYFENPDEAVLCRMRF